MIDSIQDKEVILATRQTPLAIIQTQLAMDYLKGAFFDRTMKALALSTTGDRQKDWSLEKEGGKGLFTKELEDALLDGRALMAVHSAKDMPTELPKGLTIAGYIPRGAPLDVLVTRSGIKEPKIIATGSPRRRGQLQKIFPNAKFQEIRGRVDTRLKKIAQKEADATVVAAAGLNRLKIKEFPGVSLRALGLDEMIPAVGQGAIAIEMRQEDAQTFKEFFCAKTHYAVTVERAFLSALGGGCQTPCGAYFNKGSLYLYHEKCGQQKVDFKEVTLDSVDNKIKQIIKDLGL